VQGCGPRRVCLALGVAALLSGGLAHADVREPAEPGKPTVAPSPPEDEPPPPRDSFLNAPKRGKRGTWATVDAYTVGAQANLEHRHVLEREDYAAIIPRLGALASLGFGEVGAHLDTRFLFFSFGASFGGRRVWRTYAFPDGVEGTRQARLDIDKGKAFTTESWLFGEWRVRMVLPVHDNVFVATAATARYEGCPDNSFDWFHTTMHDGGLLVRYDASVLFRHPKLGAIGPSFRALQLPRRGGRDSELAVGLTGGRRLGLVNNDLLLLNVLTRPGDPNFGFHILRLPIFVLLAYRVSFEL